MNDRERYFINTISELLDNDSLKLNEETADFFGSMKSEMSVDAMVKSNINIIQSGVHTCL
jgi:hypothetical protein